MTLGWDLVVYIQHLPCLVRIWCMFGGSVEGLIEEHSILLYGGSNSFWHAKRCSHEFGPQWTEIGCSSSKSNHCLQACTTSGNKLSMLYAKQPMENHRGPTPNESPICSSWQWKFEVKSFWFINLLQIFQSWDVDCFLISICIRVRHHTWGEVNKYQPMISS